MGNFRKDTNQASETASKRKEIGSFQHIGLNFVLTVLFLTVPIIASADAFVYDHICIEDGVKASIVSDGKTTMQSRTLDILTKVKYLKYGDGGIHIYRLADGTVVAADGDKFKSVYTAFVKALNVRKEPSLSGGKITTIQTGDPVIYAEGKYEEIRAEADGYQWVQVRLPNGESGWVANKYLMYNHQYMYFEKAADLAVKGEMGKARSEIEKVIATENLYYDKRIYNSTDNSIIIATIDGGPGSPHSGLIAFKKGEGITWFTDWGWGDLIWSNDSRYFAFFGGSYRPVFTLIDTANFETVHSSIFTGGNYGCEFASDNLFVWSGYSSIPENTGVEIDYYDDTHSYRIGEILPPCVYAYDFEKGKVIKVLIPDLDTLYSPEGGGVTIELKLSGEAAGRKQELTPVFESPVYKNLVGKRVTCGISEA